MVARKPVDVDLEHACLTFTQAQQSGHVRSFESMATIGRHVAFLAYTRGAPHPGVLAFTPRDREASYA